MVMDIIEEFFTGYCKKHNTTQMLTAEYSQDEDGYFSLENVTCEFGNCPYSGECTVIRQALAKEDEEPA